MKLRNLALMIAVLTAPSAYASWDGGDLLVIPSLQDQWEQAQLDRLDDLIEYVETADEYSGTYFATAWKGQLYKAVDRRGEPAKKRPGVTPGRGSSVSSFINGLSSEARAQIKIQVQVQYNKDGSVSSETWNLDFNAGWQTCNGMDEAMSKQHK